MASSTSNNSNEIPGWFKACLRCCGCVPMKREKRLTPGFHAIPYATAEVGDAPYNLPNIARPEPTPFLRSVHSQSTLARPGTASSMATVRTPFPANSGNVYGHSTSDPRSRWAKADLNATQFTELLDSIHETLAHVPYAVCGLAALYDHGYSTRRLNAVSILCPEHSKDNIRGWLKTRGYETYGDFFGIPIGERGYANDGAIIYRVRVKWLEDENFARLERNKSKLSNAVVLGLADQLDYCAMSFLFQLRLCEDLQKSLGEGEKTQELARSQARLRMAAQDAFWCLDKAAKTHQKLDMRALTVLTSERFWIPFTTMYERARTEMARAGIDVAGVLKMHRDQKELKEHEAMLRQFGDKGVVVTQQPGPFEGMQTFGANRSMYSIANGGEFEPAIPTEPVPPLPSKKLSPKAAPFVPSGSANRERLLAGLRRVSSVSSGKGKSKNKAKGKNKGKGKGKEADKGRPLIGNPTNPTATTHGGQNLMLGPGASQTDPTTVPLPKPSQSEWN
ncbi:hypothetical protein ABKA04_008459 [Annulohypoxylon sp. FPYF3050]